MKLLYRVYGWIIIRPIRWFFWKMIRASFGPQWLPKKNYFGWSYPNIHWWLLYKTVFKFFKWVNYKAWRYFCDWTGGRRRTYPLIARAIHAIGASTAGYAISGGRCFHCNSEDGDPVELSQDEGPYFKLLRTGSTPTMDGTDHWFVGATTCPKCGYQDEISDGSL